LLGPGRLLHYRLIGAEHLTPLQGLLIGLPHDRGQRAQINARDLHRIHSIVGAVDLAHLTGAVTVQDLDFAPDRAQALRYGKSVAAGFQYQCVFCPGVTQRPLLQLLQLHPA
jgi:hypothetical protein